MDALKKNISNCKRQQIKADNWSEKNKIEFHLFILPELESLEHKYCTEYFENGTALGNGYEVNLHFEQGGMGREHYVAISAQNLISLP